MVPSRSLPVRVIKLIRDPGAIFFLAALILLVAPAWTVWFVAVFAAVNGGFLLASIAFTAARSAAGPPEVPSSDPLDRQVGH